MVIKLQQQEIFFAASTFFCMSTEEPRRPASPMKNYVEHMH